MRRSRAECRCNDRTVEPTRYADENLIETCRPGADGMLECYSQRIRCFVEGLAFEGADMIPWRPGLLATGAVRRDEKPFAGKQLLNPPEPRPAAYRVDPRTRPIGRAPCRERVCQYV